MAIIIRPRQVACNNFIIITSYLLLFLQNAYEQKVFTMFFHVRFRKKKLVILIIIGYFIELHIKIF